MFGLKLKQMSNIQPLEVVDRGSETQLQVVENFNKLRTRIHPMNFMDDGFSTEKDGESKRKLIFPKNGAREEATFFFFFK